MNTDNSGGTAKKTRGKPFAKGKDERRNIKGAPKRGDSWAETIKAISELDGPSIAAMWDTQHKEFAKLPDGITVKQLVIMSAVASLLREPSPGILKELIDRAEGKVKDTIEHSGDEARPIVFKFIDETTSAGSSNQIASYAHNARDGE